MLLKQIEYISGAKWNQEYNKWLVDFWVYGIYRADFKYHAMSKVNWTRELKKLPKKCGVWRASSHPDLTWDIIQANPDYPRDWQGISVNPNITWDIIQANPDYPWDYYTMTGNPNITWDIIQANPDKPWDWVGIAINPNITWDMFQANPDYPWDWNPRSRIPTKGECPFGGVYHIIQI